METSQVYGIVLEKVFPGALKTYGAKFVKISQRFYFYDVINPFFLL